MNVETARNSLMKNQSGPSGAHGPSQPPKNSATARAESTITFTYSAIWKRPQRIPEYSVEYPPTSSVSASGRSNGGWFVSATPAMKKVRRPKSWGAAYQVLAICLLTMSTTESECAISTTPSTESASETSYDTICAHVRIAPSSEYFDSDAQPPTM